MEQLADVVPMVQVLDFLVVLGRGDRVMEVLRKLDVPSVEQVIAVPEISLDWVPPAFCGTPYSDGGAVGGSADEPRYSLAVVASKLFSRGEIRGILSGLGVPQGRGGGGAFKVLVLDRIQQRIWSRSLTFQLVGVFLIFSQNRVLLPHRVVCMTMRMRILQGLFALFPVRKKVRSWARTRGRNCSPSRAHPRGELMRTGMFLGDVVTSLCCSSSSSLSSWTFGCPVLGHGF